MNWQPVIVFYVKTTAWVLFPLIIGLVAKEFTENQSIFLISLVVGFGITCYGIYREIRVYKKEIEK